MRFCLRCILYRSSRGTPYRIPMDESRGTTGAFEAKRFTVIEDGVDSSVGGDLAAVRPGYAMEAQRMSWLQSSNYRQAEMLAGSFAQICKSILKKNVSSRIIAVIDDHLTASESFFYSRLNNSLPTELAQSTAYSFNRYGSGKYPAVFNGSDADNTNVLQCGGSLYRFTFLGGKRRICFKAVFCCRASNIGF